MEKKNPSRHKAIKHFQASGFKVFLLKCFAFLHLHSFAYIYLVSTLVYWGPWGMRAQSGFFILEAG